jgi:hypothetical protein
MIFKLPFKKIHETIHKLCSKFVFFIKKFKLGKSKYTIFFIFLKFQNLWNLINVFRENKL